MQRHLSIGACLLGALLLTGCDLEGGADRITKDFHYTYELTPGGHLDLTNSNGSVEIVGWDRNSIDVSGTKYAPDQQSLDRVEVKVEASGDHATIRTEIPKGNWMHGGSGVHYRLHVPRRIILDQLGTTNGAITAENLEGGGRVNSTNGKLTLTRLKGEYRFTTTNGSINLEECEGDQRAETTNGGVHGTMRTGALEAHSTNGGIDLTLDAPSSRKPIRVETTNGSITLALASFNGNPIKAETTHGSVNLRLPADIDASLQAETSMASISNELPLSSTEESSKHELRGKLGRGGPEISATSSMGSIRIQRY